MIPPVRRLLTNAATSTLVRGLVALALALSTVPLSPASGQNSITVPDKQGTVGLFTSLVLDGNGNPVVSYLHSDKGLKVLHCGDPNCKRGNSIVNPDIRGAYSSLALDGSGNPVVSYTGGINEDLRILHCGNPTCTSGNTIAIPDTERVDLETSLALDINGNPVVSYMSGVALKVLHCGNPTCTSGNTISTPDTGGVGRFSSLALDSSGNPVVSYYDWTRNRLKLLHCNDPNCAGGNESIISLEQGGQGNSLVLDSRGNPVVSYPGVNWELKLLHCNDPNCAGGNESITSPDTSGVAVLYTSLVLDSSGNPVVSYYDWTNKDLKVMHCNDPNCAPVLRPPLPPLFDESIVSADTGADVGQFNSMALDRSGNPVVSYFNNTSYDLKVLHCINPNCN